MARNWPWPFSFLGDSIDHYFFFPPNPKFHGVVLCGSFNSGSILIFLSWLLHLELFQNLSLMDVWMRGRYIRGSIPQYLNFFSSFYQRRNPQDFRPFAERKYGPWEFKELDPSVSSYNQTAFYASFFVLGDLILMGYKNAKQRHNHLLWLRGNLALFKPFQCRMSGLLMNLGKIDIQFPWTYPLRSMSRAIKNFDLSNFIHLW